MSLPYRRRAKEASGRSSKSSSQSRHQDLPDFVSEYGLDECDDDLYHYSVDQGYFNPVHLRHIQPEDENLSLGQHQHRGIDHYKLSSEALADDPLRRSLRQHFELRETQEYYAYHAERKPVYPFRSLNRPLNYHFGTNKFPASPFKMSGSDAEVADNSSKALVGDDMDSSRSSHGSLSKGFDNPAFEPNKEDGHPGDNSNTSEETLPAEAVNLELVEMANQASQQIKVPPQSTKGDVELGIKALGGMDSGVASYEEQYISINEHKKGLRGEKLYLTRDNRAHARSRRNSGSRCFFGLVGGMLCLVLITIAILVGVGIIDPYKDHIRPESSLAENEAANDDHPKTQGVLHPDSPPAWDVSQGLDQEGETEQSQSVDIVPNVWDARLRFPDLHWNSDLADPDSTLYAEIAAKLETELKNMLLKDHGDFQVEIVGFEPGSVIAIIRITRPNANGKPEFSLASEMNNLIRNNNGYISLDYRVDESSIEITPLFDQCTVMNCDHSCIYNYGNSEFECVCLEGYELNTDGESCKSLPIVQATPESSTSPAQPEPPSDLSPPVTEEWPELLIPEMTEPTEAEQLSTTTAKQTPDTTTESTTPKVAVSEVTTESPLPDVRSTKETLSLAETPTEAMPASTEASTEQDQVETTTTTTTEEPLPSEDIEHTEANAPDETTSSQTGQEISTSQPDVRTTTKETIATEEPEAVIVAEQTTEPLEASTEQVTEATTDAPASTQVPTEKATEEPLVEITERATEQTQLETTEQPTEQPESVATTTEEVKVAEQTTKNVQEIATAQPVEITTASEEATTAVAPSEEQAEVTTTEKEAEIIVTTEASTARSEETTEEPIIEETTRKEIPELLLEEQATTPKPKAAEPTTTELTEETTETVTEQATTAAAVEVVTTTTAEPEVETLRPSVESDPKREDLIKINEQLEQVLEQIESELDNSENSTLSGDYESGGSSIEFPLSEDSRLNAEELEATLKQLVENVTKSISQTTTPMSTLTTTTALPTTTTTSASLQDIVPRNLEINAIRANNNCSEAEFSCHGDEQCIPRMKRCDLVTDCADGSDEFDCQTNTCLENEFQCSSTFQCLPESLRCDGHRQCLGSEDEQHCIDDSLSCPEDTHIACPAEGMCLEKRFLCNGASDCSDGSDEAECECARDEFRCQFGGGCVLASQRCDGVYHCADHSDEMGCLRRLDSNVIEVRYDDAWSPVCSTYWTEEFSDLACYQMGLNGFLYREDKPVGLAPEAEQYLQINDTSFDLLLQEAVYEQGQDDDQCQQVVSLDCGSEDCGNWPVSESLIDSLNSSSLPEHVPVLGYLFHLPSKSSCTFAILSPKWIVTGISCITEKERFNSSSWAVFAGPAGIDEDSNSDADLGLNSNIQIRSVKQLVAFPSHQVATAGLHFNDLALIEVVDPFEFGQDLTSVCLPEGADESLDQQLVCIHAGWGNAQAGGPSFRQFAKEIPLPAYDMESCNSTEHYNGLLDSSVICSEPQGESCTHDLGSPLMCSGADGKWRLYGLLSHEGSCLANGARHPQVFTSVDEAVVAWLKNVMGQNAV